MIKDNFLFFWKQYKRNFYYPFFPRLEICNELPEKYKCLKNPVAVFEDDINRIVIIDKYDCFAVRFHEYGHWFIWRVGVFLDGIWELFWWGLSIRSLFIKEIR